MARETAYRLRRKPGAESFAAAWDAALGKARGDNRKVTADELAQRAFDGVLKLHFYAGQHVGTERKPDNSALFRLLSQLDRSERAGRAAGQRSQGLGGGSVSGANRRG